MSEDQRYETIPLTGRMITSVDPTQLAKGDFQNLSNMRYTETGIRSIKGISKINSSALTKPSITAGIHFVKDSPAESHVIVQGVAGDGSSALYDNTTAIPGTGNFGTAIYTETAGASTGKFSPVPDGAVAYGNGKDLVIWGGNESRCSGFIVSNTDDTTLATASWDYTSKVTDFDTTTTGLIKSRFVHVASTRMIKGVKFYVKTPNASTYTTGFTATGCTRATNVVTVTKNGHGLLNGDTIKISGATPATFDATDVVITYIDANSFSYANTGADESTTVQPTIQQKIILAVKYWTSSGWTAVSSLVDGTASGGVSFAQTGEISFTSTVDLAKVRYYNNTLSYWYLFDLCNMDTTTELSFVTIDAPVQKITDLWDGVPRQITAFWVYRLGTYRDLSTNVYATDFVSGAPSTYAQLNIATSDYLVIGFSERMQGLRFNMVADSANVTASVMTVSYWNGSAWVDLSATDRTSSGTITLNSSGVVFWTPPASSSEFTRGIQTPDQFYFYKIRFNADLSAATAFYVDSIFGIPAPTQTDVYRLPVMFQNRLVLCNNQLNEGNTILIGSTNTNCVFNGADSAKVYFGDTRQVLGAVPFFSRFSNQFFENLIVGKADSIWVVDGTHPSNFAVYKISSMYGLAAPDTMKSCDLGFSNVSGTGASRNVVIWQSSQSIVMWEGSVVFPIHFDIEDVFDQTNSYAIEPTMLSKSTAFYDEPLREYHWLWASKGNTTLNMEYVFDVGRKKWFKIDRGTGKRLQLGIPVMDTNNNRYVYGGLTTGYLERLENGTDFDGNSITAIHHTGDIPLGGGWMDVVGVRNIKPLMKAKNTTTNKLQIDYYGDTGTTAKHTMTVNVGDSNNRIVQSQSGKPLVQSFSKGNYTFHSIKCTMTTNNENYCYEPVGLGVLFDKVRIEKQ